MKYVSSGSPPKFVSSVIISRKQWSKLFTEIVLVDSQLKPAWLNDFLSMKTKQLNQILDWLYKEKKICQNLRAIEVGLDLLVVNLDTFSEIILKTIQYLKKGSIVDSDQIFFCLISGRVSLIFDEVEIKNQLVSHLENILIQLKAKQSNNQLDISIDAQIFTPTVFGIALGYPIVYVDLMESTIPLTIDLSVWTFEISISKEIGKNTTSKHENHLSVDYSFSFPTGTGAIAIQSDLLEKWKRGVVDACILNGFKYNFNISSKLNANVTL